MSEALTCSFGSLKGGAGKTKATTNIAAELANRGNQVLLIDLDPQGTATGDFGILPESGYSIGELLNTPAPHQPPELADVLTEVEDLPGLTIAPANYQPLEAAERMLTGAAGAQAVKAAIVDPAKPHFDYIFIDTPPRLGMLTQAAIHASDYAIPLIGPTGASYSGASSFAFLVQDLQSFAGVTIPFWLAANWQDGAEGREVLDGLKDDQVELLETTLPFSKRASSTALNRGLPMVVAQPGYGFSQAVRAVVDEFLAREASKTKGE